MTKAVRCDEFGAAGINPGEARSPAAAEPEARWLLCFRAARDLGHRRCSSGGSSEILRWGNALPARLAGITLGLRAAGRLRRCVTKFRNSYRNQGEKMKSTPAAALTVTNLAESDDRAGAARGTRISAAPMSALTTTHLAERDEHGGTGRGVTMYNEAGKADAVSTAAKPH